MVAEAQRRKVFKIIGTRSSKIEWYCLNVFFAKLCDYFAEQLFIIILKGI
jgi:hypothetical protein